MDGPFGQELNRTILKQTGVRVLGWTYDGPYLNIHTVKKKIRVPGDLKGLKLRVPQNPVMIQMIGLTGAAVTPIPFPEIYTSLQQGVVDGLVFPLFLLRMTKVDEVIKYVNLSNFSTNWMPILINEKFYQSLSPEDRYLVRNAAWKALNEFYQSLSPEDRYLVRNAAWKALNVHRGTLFWGDGLVAEYLKERGLEIHFCNAEEITTWEKAMKTPMIAWMKEHVGSEMVDKCLKAHEQVQKELGVPK
jgi:TRAP-type C4-dicarboxylate transport system substrate-binding protein